LKLLLQEKINFGAKVPKVDLWKILNFSGKTFQTTYTETLFPEKSDVIVTVGGGHRKVQNSPFSGF
jgi:hypothetical protein